MENTSGINRNAVRNTALDGEGLTSTNHRRELIRTIILIRRGITWVGNKTQGTYNNTGKWKHKTHRSTHETLGKQEQPPSKNNDQNTSDGPRVGLDRKPEI